MDPEKGHQGPATVPKSTTVQDTGKEKRDKLNKRAQLSIGDKLNILVDLDKGTPRKLVCEMYKCDKGTISKLVKNRAVIESTVNTTHLDRKRMRNSCHPQLDRLLLEWFTLQRAQNVPLNGIILLEKAHEFARTLNINVEEENGKVDTNWITRFKERHGISFRNITGEAESISLVWRLVSQGYGNDDIFNAAECGLYYKMLPDHSMEYKDEKCAGGNLANQRVTVVCCANAAGTEKKKLVLIGRYGRPHCFQNINMNNLPVHYESNVKSWLTSELFSSWLQTWDRELQPSNRKVLLILDNCSAHPKEVAGLTNMKLVFLPPNTTSILQPMDKGIIKSFKYNYRIQVIEKEMSCIYEKRDFEMNMMDVAFFCKNAWDSVQPATIRHSFVESRILCRDGTAPQLLCVNDDMIFHTARGLGVTVPVNMTFQEYCLFDDGISTSAVSGDDVPQDNSGKPAEVDSEDDEDEDEEDDEDEDDESNESSINEATLEDARISIEKLRIWALENMDSNSCAETCDMLRKVELSVLTKTIQVLHQKKITDYFLKREQ